MKVKRILREDEIANQIANLVNAYNQWSTRFSGQGINRSSALYIVESFDDIVVGTVGIDQKNDKWTEIKHLVVRPEMRSVGLGKTLVKRALEEVETPFVFANIRSTNRSSLKVFTSNGFFPYSSVSKTGYNLVTVVRFKNEKANNSLLNLLRSRANAAGQN